jgi:hypothetical protein
MNLRWPKGGREQIEGIKWEKSRLANSKLDWIGGRSKKTHKINIFAQF